MSPPAKSCADTEDKDLMLDKDMEKETWNFKSMADDDPMDFGFEPVAKNKKNAFKMDMGFDLDGDFGNLPSFKMDMPDFDFSSPSKKTTKTKESSDDKSSGDVKKNKDIFGFSYDFNGLDDFDLDSSLPRKGTETKTKTMDREEIAAVKKTDKSDAFDFDLDLSPPKKGTETKTKTINREEITAGRKTDNTDALDIDLDSSVQKKGTTAKTKTMDHEEISAGRKTEKSDALNYDLDLSPPKKGVETKTKTVGREEISVGRKFDKSDAMDFGLDLPMTRQAASKAKTEIDVKANASADTENQVSNTTDSMVVDNSTQSKQTTPENRENPEALESPQSPKLDSSKTHMMHLQPQSVDTSPLKSSRPVIEEVDECLSNETEAFLPSHASEAAHIAGNRETSSAIHEMCRSGTKEDCPRDPDQNAYNKMVSSESTYEKFEPEISYQLCLDKTEQQEEMGRDTLAEVQDQTRRTLRDPDTEHSQKNLSGKISSGTRPSQTAKVQDLSAKLPLAPSQSSMEIDTQESTVDQTRKTQCDLDAKHPPTSISGIIPPDSRSSLTSQIQDSNAKLQLAPLNSDPDRYDLKAMQTKDSGLIRSRFFKKPEQPESNVLKSSSARTESRPVGRVSSGIQDAIPGSGTRRRPLEPVNTDSEKNAENVNVGSSHEKKIIHKDNSNVKTVEHVAGLLDRSKMQAKNTTRERSMLQINISSKLDSSSLTQKLSKHLSSGVESLQKSKIVPLERPKLGNSMSDLRSEQTKRTIGVNKDQPSSAVQPELSSSINKESHTERPVLADLRAAKTQRGSGVNKDQSISAMQPEVISAIRKERNTETPDKKSSESHQLAPRDKSQTLYFPSSLKRKALDEDVDRSLTPQLKRFSMSPRENRNVEELTHRLAQGKFSIQESRIENNTAKEPVNDNPRVKSHHQSINMANVEIPITESNDNVEKAEAYTKELENICNILKKKHEEVKELLVRAVVNNNKLLMLNHPLYEEKIRMVQEFAAKLSLNEQQMMQT